MVTQKTKMKHPITWWLKSRHTITSSLKVFHKDQPLAGVISGWSKSEMSSRTEVWHITVSAVQIQSLCNEQDKSEWQTCQPFCSSAPVDWWSLILGKIMYFSHSSLPPVSPLSILSIRKRRILSLLVWAEWTRRTRPTVQIIKSISPAVLMFNIMFIERKKRTENPQIICKSKMLPYAHCS